jgi:tRNA(fMet)-specific endonuclease VapC
VVTVYELFTGVAKCREPGRERAKVVRLLAAMSVLPFDEPAAKRTAEVRAGLEAVGQVCGPHDLLIAGHALSTGLPVATNNVAEFSRISGLHVEDWLAGPCLSPLRGI